MPESFETVTLWRDKRGELHDDETAIPTDEEIQFVRVDQVVEALELAAKYEDHKAEEAPTELRRVRREYAATVLTRFAANLKANLSKPEGGQGDG